MAIVNVHIINGEGAFTSAKFHDTDTAKAFNRAYNFLKESVNDFSLKDDYWNEIKGNAIHDGEAYEYYGDSTIRIDYKDY